jgi:hypothetical protein
VKLDRHQSAASNGADAAASAALSRPHSTRHRICSLTETRAADAIARTTSIVSTGKAM